MAAQPGFNCAIYVGGTSTAFTGEAFTNTTGNTWKINTASKQVWNPSTLPTFYDNAVAIAAGDISSIDYLFGTVTFTGVKTGPITADGAYIPLLQIAGGHEFQVSMEADEIDDTEFGDTAYARIIGLKQASGTFGVHDIASTDQDSGGGTTTLQTLHTAQTLALFSVKFHATKAFRCWGYINSLEQSASVADQVATSLSFVSNSRYDSAGRVANFNIGDPS
jgi:hypothetical protein